MDKGRVIICPFLYPLFCQRQDIKTRNEYLSDTQRREVITMKHIKEFKLVLVLIAICLFICLLLKLI